MVETLRALSQKMSSLRLAIEEKGGQLKLAEKRMHNKTMKPGCEFAVEEVHEGIKSNVESLSATIEHLKRDLLQAKTQYKETEKANEPVIMKSIQDKLDAARKIKGKNAKAGLGRQKSNAN